MSLNEMYLAVLKEIGGWTTISDWAIKFGEMYPEQLQKAEEQAAGQKNETTGLREIAARMSARVCRNGFGDRIDVDTSERPKKVRWLSDQDIEVHEQQECEDDIAPITRREKERAQYEALEVKDKFRISEFEEIVRQLNKFFGTDFEFEHAQALANKDNPGLHHPDNIQILMRSHNRVKSSNNWERFSFEEQKEYIQSVVRIQKIVSKKMNIEVEDEVLEMIFEKLEKIFS